ncbi:MAG: VOC family protein [Thermoanaerobaculia bacterium]|nr:VOC family protein [Thermoanaerobaculia bacterium]
MAEVTSHAPGEFCWVELGTTDQNAAKGFYGKLFDWTFRDDAMGPGEVYTTFLLKGQPVAAGFKLDPKQHPGVPPHWMPYVATADADATARRAGELGGNVKLGPFDVMDFGRMAVLTDPSGAAFSVWQAKTHRGIGIHNEPGAFCWGQLNTSDMAKAEAFYTALFGWAAKTGSDDTMTYTEWVLGGIPIGGMMALPEGVPAPPHWLAYFAVADCDATAVRAASLGATTCVPPTDIPGTGRFAVFADPQGATFAIYKG